MRALLRWLAAAIGRLAYPASATESGAQQEAEAQNSSDHAQITAIAAIVDAEIQRRRAHDEQSACQGQKNFRLAVLNLIVLFLTLGAVIWYAYVAHGQWRAMRRANRLARTTQIEARISSAASLEAANKALRISQRAYISFRVPKAYFSRREVEIYFDNVGRTPASDVVVNHLTFRMEDGRIDRRTMGFGGRAYAAGTSVWFPGVPHKIVIALPNLSNTEQGLIRSGRQILTIAGVVSYKDGFEQDHSAFCLSYEPDPENWSTCDPMK